MEAGEILLRRGLLERAAVARLARSADERFQHDRQGGRAGLRQRRRRAAGVGRRSRDRICRPERRADRSLSAVELPAAIDLPRHAVSPASGERQPGRRHERSVRSLSAGRSRRGDRPVGDSRAGPAPGHRQADQDAPGRRQRDDRRPDGATAETTASSCSTRSKPTVPSCPRWPRRRRSSGW